MSTARLGLEYLLSKFKLGNALTDKAYNNMSILYAKEAVYNMKGEKVSKSYYSHYKDKEIVRQEYSKVIGTHRHEGIDYPNIFIGVDRKVYHMFWDGVAHFKGSHKFMFTLSPVYLGDGTSTIVGFSSQKKRKFLKEERYNADDYLQSKNPTLYAFVYNSFATQYEGYLRTGDKTPLVVAITDETDTSVLAVLDMEVAEMPGVTIRNLILSNLQ